ncbi:hypothetical protein ACJJTC_006770 [Scirpophaga incertulas]
MKRRNQQSDISSFFKKAAISEPEPGTSHSASSSDFIAESPSTASGKAIDLEHDSDSNKCDIYNYVHNLDPQLDNVSKLNMLENIWKPPNNFNFPLHEHGGHKRRFQASWMSTYEWLSYSKSLEGGFYVVLLFRFLCKGTAICFVLRNKINFKSRLKLIKDSTGGRENIG